MPNTKISNLTSAGTLTGTEELPLVQSSTTKKTTLQDVSNFANISTCFAYNISVSFSSFTFSQMFNNTGITITPSWDSVNNQIKFTASSSLYSQNKTFLSFLTIYDSGLNVYLYGRPFYISSTLVQYNIQDNAGAAAGIFDSELYILVTNFD